MEIMKKIGLVFVIAALGVAGYVLVSRHSAMSESGNVVIQNKKVGLGGFCKHDDSCKSGKCKDGTCRAKDGACRKNNDCAQDTQYCDIQNSKCKDKIDDGHKADTGGMPIKPLRSSCKSNEVDTTNGKCCSGRGCTGNNY